MYLQALRVSNDIEFIELSVGAIYKSRFLNMLIYDMGSYQEMPFGGQSSCEQSRPSSLVVIHSRQLTKLDDFKLYQE